MHEDLTSAPNDSDDALADSDADVSLEEWKRDLRAEFDRWLDSLDAIPGPESDDGDPPDDPDLYSFYEQLAAATTEARKSNRRTAEAFSQWGQTLTQFDGELRLLREQLARQPGAADDALPRSWCLALIEITDRMHRLATVYNAPPPRGWLGSDARWRTTWDAQRQGHDILMSHVTALVARAGVMRIPALHQPFDPTKMAAVVAEPSTTWPPNTVIEEITPGYLLRGDLLRVAQVKVSAPHPAPPGSRLS